MPLYPTEKIIWDENIVPTEYYSGEGACQSQRVCSGCRVRSGAQSGLSTSFRAAQGESCTALIQVFYKCWGKGAIDVDG